MVSLGGFGRGFRLEVVERWGFGGLVSNLIRILFELINSDFPLSGCLHVISLLMEGFPIKSAITWCHEKEGERRRRQMIPLLVAYEHGCLILNRYDASTTRAITVLSVFQPAWSDSSATGDVGDAVSVLLWIILERLNPASDSGCVTQEWLVCYCNTDWNKTTWSDNMNTNSDKHLLLNPFW